MKVVLATVVEFIVGDDVIDVMFVKLMVGVVVPVVVVVVVFNGNTDIVDD